MGQQGASLRLLTLKSTLQQYLTAVILFSSKMLHMQATGTTVSSTTQAGCCAEATKAQLASSRIQAASSTQQLSKAYFCVLKGIATCRAPRHQPYSWLSAAVQHYSVCLSSSIRALVHSCQPAHLVNKWLATKLITRAHSGTHPGTVHNTKVHAMLMTTTQSTA